MPPLSEGSQSAKATCCMMPSTSRAGNSKTMKSTNRSGLASAREEGGINRWSAGEFQSHATVPLCRTATVASVQIQRGTGGRGGPNVNLS